MAALEEKTIARSSSASDFVEDDGSPPSAEQDEQSRVPEPLPPFAFPPTRRAMPRGIIGLTLGISAVAVMVTLFILGIPWSISSPKDYVYPVVAVLLGLLLALVPVLLCLVQTTARTRQLLKLDSLKGLPGSGTRYFQVAKLAIGSVNPVSLGVDYTLPLITFFVVMLLSCLMLLMSSFALDIFTHPSFLLAGMNLVNPTDALPAYQKGTFVVVTMAFVGAYVYTLGQLLDRLNNNDLYPISFYYYSARIIIACLTAIVFRHAADSVYIEGTQPLVLLGFVSGLAPDLFILAMARRAFQSIKVFGSKADPDPQFRPAALPLLMLDDLTKEKIDRLGELGIDSAQVLACQNPFLIWPRLPYDLGLIVDWIAEAQLYALVKEKGLSELRKKYVTDIFDLHGRLADKESCAEVAGVLELDPKSAPALVKQIEDDQSFTRLKEVRDALQPKSGEAGAAA